MEKEVGENMVVDYQINSTRHAFCEEHGEYVSRYYFGDRWSGCLKCADIFNAKILAEKAEEKLIRDSRVLHTKLSKSGIPAEFQKSRLTNYVYSDNDDVRAKQLALLKDAQAYVNNFAENLQNSRCMFFLGHTGNGKTHIACAIGIALIEAGYTVKYTTIDDYFITIRDTYKASSPKSELMIRDEYAGYDFLILDEMGVQSNSETEDRLMISLLDKRYRDLKSTLFISNKDRSELEEILGARLVSRIKQGGALMKYFTWNDFRIGKK